MPVLEKAIEKAVKKYAEKNGCLTYKMNGLGHRGWPDRMFLRGGRALFIEFKRAGCKPTPLQAHIHEQLREAGFEVLVVDDVLLGRMAVEELWVRKETKHRKHSCDGAVYCDLCSPLRCVY